MAEISLQNISNHALRQISLNIADREFLVVLGPSGAGKTSLLDVLAGMSPYRGRVLFQGKPVDHLPPYQREVGYVFQDLLLFPHLSVQRNLLLAMRRLKMSRRQKRDRADEILELFRLAHLAGRLPGELSGGEKQRCALARAVASEPKILLLDEPFASLDFRTARYLRQELKRLQQRLGLTTLFVTHNLAEARELAERIAVLREGRLEQVGAPDEIWFGRPGREGFLETPNLLECTDRVTLGNGLVEVRWGGLKLLVPDESRAFSRVAISPQEVYISLFPPPGPPINRFRGRVREVRKGVDTAMLVLDVEGNTLRAELTLEQLDATGLSVEDEVHGLMKLRELRVC